MTNKLTRLFMAPTVQRKVNDYEEMYDEFVAFARGARISEKFHVPEGKKNADYYFALDKYEIVLELKQLSKYSNTQTVDQYFSKRLFEGKIKRFEYLPNNQIRINPNSLNKAEWRKFYKQFKPSISKDLKDAAIQLKETESFLPLSQKRRFKGVMLINTGDFNLSTDLLFRLVEFKMKQEWRIGNFSSIDFVTCITIDMFKENQNPLYSRHIARTAQDIDLVTAVHYLFDRWIVDSRIIPT